MVTFFIFYDDLKYATFLSNSISASNSNMQLIGIDEKISENSLAICNQILPHIIIATNMTHKELTQKLNFNYTAINISQKLPIVTQKICNQVNKFANDSSYYRKFDLYNFKKYAYVELQKNMFNPALTGTQYLLDCIVSFRENPIYNLNKVNIKNLYAPIARKYGTNIETVSWNIHSSISDMCKATTSDFRLYLYGVDEVTPHMLVEMFSNLY